MTDWTIEQADVAEWAEAHRGEPFHAVLCDPSYGLGDDVDAETLLATADEEPERGARQLELFGG